MDGQSVSIRLHLQHTPELAMLPWEYLYDESNQSFLTLSTATPITRFVSLPQPVPPLQMVQPLRILGVVSSPQDMVPLDVVTEVIQPTVTDAPTRTPIEAPTGIPTVTDEPTPTNTNSPTPTEMPPEGPTKTPIRLNSRPKIFKRFPPNATHRRHQQQRCREHGSISLDDGR
ncbi:MAG: hypothetical protein AAF702_27105 [Chloroflexota bacterium]